MEAMPPGSDVVYEWRGEVDNATVNHLHAERLDRPPLDIEWRTRLESRVRGGCAPAATASWSGS